MFASAQIWVVVRIKLHCSSMRQWGHAFRVMAN